MTYFITKVWGWREPIGPLVFASSGWRDNAVEKLRPNDRVVLVGTTDEPTVESEQGRLLGIMEPTTEMVRSLDFPRPLLERDYDENGIYKWPYGLLNVRAWTFEDRPLLCAISNRRFNMDAVRGIVALTADEARKVDALPKRPAEMAQATATAQERIAQAVGTKSYTAPPPTTLRRGVMHMRRARAYTYLMELVGATRPTHKIGWAFDWKTRENTFNHHALPELGGLRYKTMQHHLWSTATEAFRMEQALLRRFQGDRQACNNEIIVGVERSDIDRAWFDALARH